MCNTRGVPARTLITLHQIVLDWILHGNKHQRKCQRGVVDGGRVPCCAGGEDVWLHRKKLSDVAFGKLRQSGRETDLDMNVLTIDPTFLTKALSNRIRSRRLRRDHQAQERR